MPMQNARLFSESNGTLSFFRSSISLRTFSRTVSSSPCGNVLPIKENAVVYIDQESGAGKHAAARVIEFNFSREPTRIKAGLVIEIIGNEIPINLARFLDFAAIRPLYRDSSGTAISNRVRISAIIERRDDSTEGVTTLRHDNRFGNRILNVQNNPANRTVHVPTTFQKTS